MYHGSQFGLFSQRMVRDYHWKYVWNATAKDELYNLLSDPAELHNLINDPAHAGAADSLRKQLEQWMVETGDHALAAFRNRHFSPAFINSHQSALILSMPLPYRYRFALARTWSRGMLWAGYITCGLDWVIESGLPAQIVPP